MSHQERNSRRSMPSQLVAAAVVALLPVAVATCAGAATTAPGPASDAGTGATMQAPLSEEFRLRNTETAAVGSDGLTLRFDRVPVDERCPVGDPCEGDPGDAIVEVTLHQAPSDAATVQLHTAPQQRTDVTYLGYRVRLVRLEPRPVGEQHVPLQQYFATFVVSLR